MHQASLEVFDRKIVEFSSMARCDAKLSNVSRNLHRYIPKCGKIATSPSPDNPISPSR